MTNMFGANGMISAPQVTRVQDSDIPLSTHGLIAVRGAVNTTNNVALSANDVIVTGIVETGQNGVVAIENLVNMNRDRIWSKYFLPFRFHSVFHHSFFGSRISR